MYIVGGRLEDDGAGREMVGKPCRGLGKRREELSKRSEVMMDRWGGPEEDGNQVDQYRSRVGAWTSSPCRHGQDGRHRRQTSVTRRGEGVAG